MRWTELRKSNERGLGVRFGTWVRGREQEQVGSIEGAEGRVGDA